MKANHPKNLDLDPRVPKNTREEMRVNLRRTKREKNPKRNINE